MRAQRSNGFLAGFLWRRALIPAAVGLVLAGPPAIAQAQENGVVCTGGPTFTLVTGTGYVQLPDGNTAFMWGYGSPGFQHPMRPFEWQTSGWQARA